MADESTRRDLFRLFEIAAVTFQGTMMIEALHRARKLAEPTFPTIGTSQPLIAAGPADDEFFNILFSSEDGSIEFTRNSKDGAIGVSARPVGLPNSPAKDDKSALCHMAGDKLTIRKGETAETVLRTILRGAGAALKMESEHYEKERRQFSDRYEPTPPPKHIQTI